MNEKFCPCHSEKPYEECCQKYHKGEYPPNALALMRSRYSAYALNLTDYIIETGDPSKSHDREQIDAFSKNTKFNGLEILGFIDGEDEAYVKFHAILEQNQQDVSFIEKSRFIKDNGRWLYIERV